jgi:hypothetical protein
VSILPRGISLLPVQESRMARPQAGSRLPRGLPSALRTRPRSFRLHITSSGPCHSFVCSTDRFHLLTRSEPCRMAERQIRGRINRDRQRHLLAVHSGGYLVRPAQSHGALTTREEAMTGTWRWPKPNSRRVIESRPRTTISTPNIISD